jgi:hypothetical protein
VTDARTPLKGQTRRMGSAAVDLGQVSSSMSSGRMVLWLRRSAEQKAQLGQYLSQVQNPASANYRHWMTPAGYGAAYGISDHDLAAVKQWLQSNGLEVEKVSAGRNAILFSGTAGSLASAFHTTIHSYMVGQQKHFANATDPEVPTALAPVIAGISPMNDFRPQPLHVLGKAARYDAASHHVQPAMTGGDSSNGYSLYVTPADASIIYDTPNKNYNPAATQTLDGTGVTIGIVGYSALAMADVQNYRTAFLPAGAASNLPKQILDGGTDPGVIAGSVASEGLLDVEIAGGLAPGAQINYYYAASTDLSDGLILASLRALEENKVNILSVSYGQCEADLGTNGNLAWSELWQQAAAQGISVTVSTGDSGSATCDGSSQVEASHGLAVNGLASTPYNIAVGGTDFYGLINNFSSYVDTTGPGNYPYYATALGYIPETPWNDSSIAVGKNFSENLPTSGQTGDTNIIGGGGGLSSEVECQGYTKSDGSCSQSLSGYTQPPYQTGFQQVKLVRSIPDVSLLSANGFLGAAWVYCSDSTVDQQGGVYSDCQTDSNGQLIDGVQIGLIGGTSAAAPAFAGMLAMISQSQGGARLGQANTVLYNLAQDYGKYQRAFHDVTIGNNSVYCASDTLNCDTNNFLEGYNATPSYDMATGLGSVDLSQLISLWTATNFASTTNVLTAGTSSDSLSSAPISVAHGTPLNFSTTVTPGDATGQFSIVATGTATDASFNDFGTLDGSAVGNLTTSDLPGGTYTVYAYYAGDTSHTGSQSSNGISMTISPESSTTTLSFGAYDPVTYALSEGASTVPYGYNTFINAQPFGNNSTADWSGNLLADGIATGSVTFTSSDGKTQSAAINSVGLAQLSASSFLPGTYTYQASYSGDASFAPSTSTTQTLTITKASTSFQLQSSAAAVNPVGQVALTAILQTDSIALFPTGSVSAGTNGHTYPPTSGAQGYSNGADAYQFTFSIPASDLVAGSNQINVNYGGDTNYEPANASLSVTLIGETGSFTLSGPDQPLVVQASQESSTTISVAPLNGFTGQVNMTCTVSAAPSGHTPTCQGATAIVYSSYGASSVVSVATYADTPAGNYTITVTGISGPQSQSVQIPMQVTDGPGFALSAANGSLSVASPGQSVTNILTIRPVGGFTGKVQLSCTVFGGSASSTAPTCTVPATASITGSSVVNVTLTVNTVSSSTARAAREGRLFGERLGGLALGCLLIFVAPKRRAWTALGLLLLTAGALSVTACGGGHTNAGTGTGTPAGNYKVTVTAVSGSVTATTLVQLTVQ